MSYLNKLLQNPKALANRVAGIANGVLILLVAFDLIDWSTEECLSAIAVLTSVILLAGATWAHFQPGSPREWALVGGTLTAFVTTLVLWLNQMDWTEMSEGQLASVVGLIALIFGISSSEVVRSKVMPMASVQVYKNVEPQDAFYAEEANGQPPQV
jgi:hypothetical protein